MYHYSVFFQYLFKRRKHFFYLIRRSCIILCQLNQTIVHKLDLL